MKEQIKKFLNEEQDPKAIEKITSKLTDLLMKNEEIGYIGVQKNLPLRFFRTALCLQTKGLLSASLKI